MQNHLELAARGKYLCGLNSLICFFLSFLHQDLFSLALGPLRQTFTHNPLLQHGKTQPPSTPNSSNAKPKQPWRDTLG